METDAHLDLNTDLLRLRTHGMTHILKLQLCDLESSNRVTVGYTKSRKLSVLIMLACMIFVKTITRKSMKLIQSSVQRSY